MPVRLVTEQHQGRGAYSIVGVTGTMAAGLSAASPFFSFRWTSTAAKALVDRITVSAASLGTGFAAGVGKFDAVIARSFTVTDYGGAAAPTMTSAVASESGGVLGAGDYYYKVTALGPWGETAGSTESGAATITGETGSVTVTYGSVSGATGYRVYRGTATGEQNVWYSDAASTYVDTGATPTGSGAPSTPDTGGGLVLTTNNAKRRTGFSTSLLTSARMSYTAALVAGTRTLDDQPFAAVQFGVSTAQNTVHLSTRDGVLWDSDRCGDDPIVLAANEGFVIRATVPATGTWSGIVSVDWREV